MPTRLVVVVIVVLALGIAALIARPQLRIAVPDEVTVPMGGTGTLAATLLRKGWGFGSFVPVPGTVELRTPVSPHYTFDTHLKTTTAAAPDALFTIYPQSVGTGQQQVWGRSAYGSHASWFSSGPWVTIKITGTD